MTTADTIFTISAVLLCVLTYAWGWTQYCRAKNLERQLDRMCATMDEHLAATDEFLANMKELERYNASLELKIAMLDTQRRGGVSAFPITWHLN